MTLRDKKIAFLAALLIAIPLAITGLQMLLEGRRDEAAYLQLAQESNSRQDWPGLLALAKEWQQRYPQSGLAYAAIGDAYYQQRQLAEAIAAYTVAVKLDASIPEVWTRFGASLFNTGRYAEAIEACSNGTKLRPEFGEAWLCLGLSYAFSGDAASATMVMRKLTEIAPPQAAQMREVVKLHACQSQKAKLGKAWCPD